MHATFGGRHHSAILPANATEFERAAVPAVRLSSEARISGTPAVAAPASIRAVRLGDRGLTDFPRSGGPRPVSSHTVGRAQRSSCHMPQSRHAELAVSRLVAWLRG